MAKIGTQTLIGQNEEPFLEAALRSVPWVDYFVVVNTAPDSVFGKQNQATVEKVAAELGIELRFKNFIPDPDGLFSFGEARNMALSMSDPDDYVFIVDSDDVHFPEWELQVKTYIEQGYDSITAHYFHLMVFKDVYQAVYPREIIYRNYDGTQWTQGVHEQLVNKKDWSVVSTYHYMHYGYIKPQEQVFRRWKFYSDIVGDVHHYDGQDPKNIVSDRLSVSKVLQIAHPAVVREVLEAYPSCPDGALNENWEVMPAEKVGLVLLTYNDASNLPTALAGLARTKQVYSNFEVIAIDMGSTDNSVELMDEYVDIIGLDIYETGELLPLASTLNFGFNIFRQRHDIQYIGWVHPDMRFDDALWLSCLVDDLRSRPRIGKICAANTRDNVPADYLVGHEQCYILRKEILNSIGLFDEGYKGIGGYEDWDMNLRIMNHDNYKVMISPRALVYHEGMATRSRRDTTADQIHNAQYYHNKWGTDKAPC